MNSPLEDRQSSRIHGRQCQGCGTALPLQGRGRPRKWCNERCRRDTSYVCHCVDCGARLNSSDGNGPSAPLRCVMCSARHNGEMRKVWTRSALIEAMERWADIHGAPPRVVDWRGVAESPWPHADTVIREFGSWKDGMVAAGFKPRAAGRPRRVAA